VDAPLPNKWSPPVIELLVDPWAKKRLAAPASPSPWEPQVIEIIDPWAAKRPVRLPAASSPVGTAAAPIF
ncbi:MAG TPA: hypothetical protein VEX18_01380, partial [Polyangiaceae bacterium]|nr:hypothetical protein [Polyangiaceae bacterium]